MALDLLLLENMTRELQKTSLIKFLFLACVFQWSASSALSQERPRKKPTAMEYHERAGEELTLSGPIGFKRLIRKGGKIRVGAEFAFHDGVDPEEFKRDSGFVLTGIIERDIQGALARIGIFFTVSELGEDLRIGPQASFVVPFSKRMAVFTTQKFDLMTRTVRPTFGTSFAVSK